MQTIKNITIARIGNGKTVCMAVKELKHYLNLMDSNVLIDVRAYDEFDKNLPDLLWVGVDDILNKKLKFVETPKADDAICIEVEDFCGFITGANERAVLIAVYRFLRELGARWLCPGEIGEMIPERTIDKCCVNINEVPYMRHRCVCIEGATSYEHTYDMIDWLPKVGMNSFFIQFRNPYVFFKRWYSHQRNERLGNTPFTLEDGAAINEKCREDILLRGLMYHAGGHGWTTEPFGIASNGWSKIEDSEIPDETRECFAMIDGKRSLFGGVASDTQACYSNPKVISSISRAVADYCEENRGMDYVSVWLADMRNNFCECENCRHIRPADHFVNLLNAVDEELTARNIETKVAADVYNDTSWAPQKYKLKNPERFLLEFAPITRRFSESFADTDLNNLPEEWPFELNKLVMPRENPSVIKVMKGWDDFEVGDRCVFDYHFWSTTFITDAGGFKIADTLFRDIDAYKTLGINGLISCQVMRYSFPTNLPMQIMADKLWNKDADFDEIADSYLKDAFGNKFKNVRTYLEKLSEFAAYWVKVGEPDTMIDRELKSKNEKALEVIRENRPVFERIYKESSFENPVQKTFWKFLIRHLDLAETAIKLQVRKFSGESPQERLDAIDAYADAVRDAEPELHRVFDTWRQLLTLAYATPIEDAH